MRVKARVVSLTVPAKAEDVVLLVLLGQKQFRNNGRVTGAEIMNGLRQSGVRLPRADYMLRKHAGDGNVVMTGLGRTRRYSLTNAGVDRAQQIARTLFPIAP